MRLARALRSRVQVQGMDDSELIVTIDHPMGAVEVTLREWIARGPGPRGLVRPVAVRRAAGEELPLSVIPVEYRNDEESRRMIADGVIENPW